MSDLDALEALAKKATPGPWEWTDFGSKMVSPGITRKGDGKPKRARHRDRSVISIEPDGACGDPDCCPQTESLRVRDDDRAFIAACDPDTVRALIARVRRAEARAEQLEKALADLRECTNPFFTFDPREVHRRRLAADAALASDGTEVEK